MARRLHVPVELPLLGGRANPQAFASRVELQRPGCHFGELFGTLRGLAEVQVLHPQRHVAVEPLGGALKDKVQVLHDGAVTECGLGLRSLLGLRLQLADFAELLQIQLVLDVPQKIRLVEWERDRMCVRLVVRCVACIRGVPRRVVWPSKHGKATGGNTGRQAGREAHLEHNDAAQTDEAHKDQKHSNRPAHLAAHSARIGNVITYLVHLPLPQSVLKVLAAIDDARNFLRREDLVLLQVSQRSNHLLHNLAHIVRHGV